MIDGFEQTPLKDLDARTSQIVSWLKLDSVPTAVQSDPSNKLGLQDAFRLNNGVYSDPIPAKVIQKAKEDIAKKPNYATKEIPLLQEEYIGGKVLTSSQGPKVVSGGTRVPIFKEQVQATAQFLAHLGFEPPLPEATKGETFVMVNDNPTNRHVYKTADPKILVVVTRNGPNDTDQATRVALSIVK